MTKRQIKTEGQKDKKRQNDKKTKGTEGDLLYKHDFIMIEN